MSVEREDGEITFTCDACPEDLPTETDDFVEALGVLRRAGWRVTKNGNDWEHFCGCQQASAFKPIR